MWDNIKLLLGIIAAVKNNLLKYQLASLSRLRQNYRDQTEIFLSIKRIYYMYWKVNAIT